MGTSLLGTPYIIELVSSLISGYRVSPKGTSPVVGDVVLSTTLLEDQRRGAIMGTEARVEEIGCKRVQFRAAEKGGEGMALKILTRAEDIPDG